MEKIPALMKLAEIQSFNNKQDATASFDEEGGRTRLADFLYGEYSLEEVIYQLAKTMFTQSLTHGSEESQSALQKLTQFLESEGKRGRISPALQKKILGMNNFIIELIRAWAYCHSFYRRFIGRPIGHFEREPRSFGEGSTCDDQKISCPSKFNFNIRIVFVSHPDNILNMLAIFSMGVGV